MIQTLKGHHAPVWGLALSSDGAFVVSSSQDRSIRFWRRTDEQLFLEEERERAMEGMFETDDRRSRNDTSESASAGKQTAETIRATERLLEALELAETEQNAVESYKKVFDSLYYCISN